jgi:hypothetical protein
MTVLLQEPVHILRIFVSSPSDVATERELLDEIVERINGTMRSKRVRLELMKWERDVVPQIGKPPQDVVDGQMLPYGIYLGIMATRFGTPTERWGSGTEQEFRQTLERFDGAGTPWILFYFNREKLDPDKIDWPQFLQVEKFRGELAERGLYSPYIGARGTPESFFEKVDLHLRQLVDRHLHEVTTSGLAPDVEAITPDVPPGYRKWLQDYCTDVELLGLQFKQGHSIRLNNVYVPITTKAVRKQAPPLAGPRKADDRLVTLGTGEEKKVLLLNVLGEHSADVAGVPGSGKSTFCRWVAWLVCEGRMPQALVSPPAEYEESFPASFVDKLPVLVRLREFWGAFENVPDGRTASADDFDHAFRAWLAAKRATDLTLRTDRHWSCSTGWMKYP